MSTGIEHAKRPRWPPYLAGIARARVTTAPDSTPRRRSPVRIDATNPRQARYGYARQAGAAARLATGTLPRPRSRLHAALRDGPAPARTTGARTPNGAPRDAREPAKPETVSGPAPGPRNPRDTPADGHIREAARRARDEANG